MYIDVHKWHFLNSDKLRTNTWKQPKCPSTDEWIKMWYVYTVEYYLALQMNEIMPFAATWMQLEMIVLSETNQKERKYQPI